MRPPAVLALAVLTLGCAGGKAAADAQPPPDVGPSLDLAMAPDTAAPDQAVPDLALPTDLGVDAPADVAADVSPDLAAEVLEVAPDLAADQPSLLSNGEACTGPAMCESGWCTDGVCCDSDCRGTCQSCNLPDRWGTCSSMADGTDPEDECPEDPRSTCRRDGSCDGQGACRRFWPAGTVCAAPTCVGSVESSRRICDGAGNCPAPTTRTCAQGCAGGSCPAECNAANPCLAGSFCEAGGCRPLRAPGQACQVSDQCASGYCVDQVCCETACTGTCQSCALPGGLGTCRPIPLGSDPNQECPADLTSACGRAGGCDGAGACRYQSEGAPCGGGMVCAGTTESTRACNGRGTCASVSARSCAPYRCAGTACGVTCLINSDCAPGAGCSAGGVCVPYDAGP